MINYFELGGDKQLNEIVMAGSHDAGITSGGSNVQTQDLDIGGQAAAGVRIFDLRVTGAASSTKHGGVKQAELRAFHADPKLMKDETKTRFMPEVGRAQTITRTKLRGGAFGSGLTGMLQQAKSFVEANDTEFLILKFDKCTNWELIAEVCVSELGSTIYQGAGNLNTTPLKSLKGRVVCLFTAGGMRAIPPKYKGRGGILDVVNLSGGGAYHPSYQGMQYFGKGGTSVFQPFGKLGQNEKRQGKLMARAAGGDPEVMGMMYWTTTGMSESIRKRNEAMWSDKNVSKLRKLWSDGLADAIESRVAGNIDPTSYASAPVLKAFMPNMVMIDFADANKCQQIYDLNSVAGVALTAAARQLDQDVKRAQAQYATMQRRGRV